MTFCTRAACLTLPGLLAACASGDRGGPLGDTGAPGSGACVVSLEYTPAEGAEAVDAVLLAADFTDWEQDALPMEEASLGTWRIELELDPGAYPYRFVEQISWSQDDYEVSVCDPEAALIHCPEDYKEPWETDWSHTCASGVEAVCNSLLVVPDCTQPSLRLDALDVDRAAGSVSLSATFGPNVEGTEADRIIATLDGESVSGSFDGTTFALSLSGLEPGRHTVRLQALDRDGHASEEVYVPLWTDVTDPEQGWREGSVYYAFVDRLADGDPGNTSSEGTSAELGDYMGGDFQGVIDLLPYLDDLGVRTIWLSNPQDNAEGDWAGQCGETFSGYHAYWPDEALKVEDHFGGDDALRQLVDEAHARDMRVIMDWVANHVHSDHPYYLQHEADGWFNELELCEDSVGGQLNFDRIPETCWFAPYLPDIDYTRPEPLHLMVEDALWWVKTYELDGLRVDAAKHMSHAVQWNLQARVRAEIEHTAVGGEEQFWTVGETFDGYERIAAYMGPEQLDGQFDFPLYYVINGAFATRDTDLRTLQETVASSAGVWEAAHSDALMSSFLGNHDVLRFVSYAAEGYVSSCQGGDTLVAAEAPSWEGPYQGLRLAWVFLFTQPDIPLVYYGDELGLPGYTDPDNRQPLWWHVGDMSGGAVSSVEDLSALASEHQQPVLETVAVLGRARQEHPAFWRGSTTEWWLSPSDWPTVWGYARVDEATGDELLVIINNSEEAASLTNGLGFAGLSADATFEDLLTGESFTASGDSLTVDVGALDARVLVKR